MHMRSAPIMKSYFSPLHSPLKSWHQSRDFTRYECVELFKFKPTFDVQISRPASKSVNVTSAPSIQAAMPPNPVPAPNSRTRLPFSEGPLFEGTTPTRWQ